MEEGAEETLAAIETAETPLASTPAGLISTAVSVTAPSQRVAKRDRRFRAHRIRLDELALGEVIAAAAHPDLGTFDAVVEDLSLHGMGLAVHRTDRAGLVLSGDRLEDLKVKVGSNLLYVGSAQVRRVSEDASQLVLGVELNDRGIDLDALYRLDRRTSVVDRLRGAFHENESVDVEFKAWVADLRDFLEATKRCLDEEEAALAQTDRWTREEALREYINEAAPIVCDRLNRASVELVGFVEGLDESEHSSHRRFYRRHLCQYYHHAPLLRRAFQKPLGYAGDYEMMNMLYRDHAEGDSLFGKVLNVYACQEAAARANINRVEFLGERMLQAFETRGDARVRVASIGCGPAQELYDLLSFHPHLGERLDVALIDQEPDAIRYCQRRFAPLAAQTGARIHFIDESIRRLLTARSLSRALGKRDLIYSAGLFDYLGDRSFAALLSALHEALEPGGHMYVGNVNLATNTTKWSMEYCSDWHLIHRTGAQLLRFAESIPSGPRSASIESEALGVNLFLHVEK